MTRKILALNLVLLFQAFDVSSQPAISLNLEKQKWDYERKAFFISRLRPEETVSQPGGPVYLQNRDTLIRFAQFNILLQAKTDRIPTNSLNILAGASSQKAQAIIVVDKNNNDSFLDDTVYTIDLRTPVRSGEAYYARLPLINVDSVKVFTAQNKKEYISLQLRLGIAVSSETFIENIEQLRKSEQIFLDIYPSNYFAAPVHSGNQFYDFVIAEDPVAQNLRNYPGSKTNDLVVLFFKKLETKDSLINIIPVISLDRPQHKKNNAFVIGADTFKISSVSLDQRKLNLSKINHLYFVQNQTPIENSPALSEILSDSAYTLLNFSGSWCKPCEAILPKLKALHKQYSDKIKFVTIAVENDISAAGLYKEKANADWQMVYENINCNSGGCLKTDLQVTAFPTLILMAPNKKIILRQVGSGGAEPIEQKMKELVKE